MKFVLHDADFEYRSAELCVCGRGGGGGMFVCACFCLACEFIWKVKMLHSY